MQQQFAIVTVGVVGHVEPGSLTGDVGVVRVAEAVAIAVVEPGLLAVGVEVGVAVVDVPVAVVIDPVADLGRGRIAVRVVVVAVTVVAYVIALTTRQQIFDIAIKYAFTGYAALAPVTIAAVFWKRGTKYGALASTLVVMCGLLLIAYLEAAYPETGSIPGIPLLTRTPGGVVFFRGLLPVVPLVLLSTLAMIIVSLLTPPPSRLTVESYFPSGVSS